MSSWYSFKTFEIFLANFYYHTFVDGRTDFIVVVVVKKIKFLTSNIYFIFFPRPSYYLKEPNRWSISR
ncbi:unnamed protein product [Rotaria magnacalcarata]|uniref:Uncharacterized protein n=1 Tax=Rotaria magnacalcarata TaxID=392030 RepID=A0A816MBA4_9BILA|nr:unnamed protein product [Rotaria magnacalcarata]